MIGMRGDELPPGLALRVCSFETEIWGIFAVCPSARQIPGHMQPVCIEFSRDIAVRYGIANAGDAQFETDDQPGAQCDPPARRLRAGGASAPAGWLVIPLAETMKIVILLLSIFLSEAAAAATAEPAATAGATGLRFFYCIHSEQSCKDTAGEVPVVSGNAALVARRVLATKDDFVGFTDARKTTLQFYVEDTDSILVDMPMPQLKGSYVTHLDRAQALSLIASLSPPLSRYRTSLKLKFMKWQ